MSKRTTLGLLAAAAYIAVIATANYAIHRWGVVAVGFGQYAPAAVYFVGAALVFRDAVQVTLGRLAMLAALTVGILLSYVTADAAIATASAAAFACSELIDFAVFTWIAPRWTRAVFAAGVVGAVVDTYVFLTVAPTLVPGLSNYHFVPGQLIGKSYGVVIATILVPAIVAAARRERVQPALA